MPTTVRPKNSKIPSLVSGFATSSLTSSLGLSETFSSSPGTTGTSSTSLACNV